MMAPPSCSSRPTRARCCRRSCRAASACASLRCPKPSSCRGCKRAARLSLGCPGHALELADHLEARAATIDDLMQALRGDTPAVLEWASVVTTGARRDSTQELLSRVELVEDLLRDVVIVGSESREPLLNADREELVRAWTRLLWPAGVTRCHDLLERARAQLQVNVQAKLVAEALMLGLRYELRGR